MGKRIDLHVHLVGAGHGSNCAISPRMRRSIQYLALTRLLGMSRRDPDRVYADRLVSVVEGATELDHACVFAMDGVYDAQGDRVPDQSHFYVPNDHAIDVCRRSDKLLPVISVNPQRRDALAELERVGPHAVALKWLAPMQRFDPSSARYEAFRRLLKELELPVIAHSGTEHTVPGVVQQLGDPELCEPLLKLGIPVIFAHCGTCSIFSPGLDQVPAFDRMLARYDCAFGDTSGFVTPVRAGRVRQFAAPRYAGRIFHGSDYPVPISALWFLPALGLKAVRELDRIANPLDRDVAIKRALGMPEAAVTGAYDLLASRIARIKGRA